MTRLLSIVKSIAKRKKRISTTVVKAGNATKILNGLDATSWWVGRVQAMRRRNEKQFGVLRAGSDYAQVERRSVTFLDQTMSRGEVFGLKKYIKIIHCEVLNILMEKRVGPLDGSLGRAFCSTQTLLERPNSWRHNFLKVLPPMLFWR